MFLLKLVVRIAALEVAVKIVADQQGRWVALGLPLALQFRQSLGLASHELFEPSWGLILPIHAIAVIVSTC